MDFVVTEAGIYVAQDAGLRRISAEKCREWARHLCQQRGLPRQRLATAAEYASPPCYAGEFPGYFGDDPDPKR